MARTHAAHTENILGCSVATSFHYIIGYTVWLLELRTVIFPLLYIKHDLGG